MNIGERIRARRMELGLSQSELANLVGYTSRSAVCRIENGDREIQHDMIMPFAKALQTTPEYIMGWMDITSENYLIYSISILLEQLSLERQEEVLDYVSMLIKREARK